MRRTINRESIRLYRDILRATKAYNWPDEKGVPWSEVLRQNARKEFEAARVERDPAMVAKLLFSGRSYLNQAQEKFAQKYHKVMEDVANANKKGGMP